ncbi:putative beta-tubulin polyglutamylase [Tetrabaena socialis]|uniref:Tubulin--tyrosine ligase-like protein 5 n=1 Tax=Tetrabaena socialis TaxID=47790 RepID=A0A2J7ZQW5_9CHLO|nr:putative beta-tubulin polyglutamylase [Tetrabaena socialis]|eukprot:PNH02661.1 putative beta-tubulin polyglutamylase [Tetrabaena socialis]
MAVALLGQAGVASLESWPGRVGGAGGGLLAARQRRPAPPPVHAGSVDPRAAAAIAEPLPLPLPRPPAPPVATAAAAPTVPYQLSASTRELLARRRAAQAASAQGAVAAAELPRPGGQAEQEASAQSCGTFFRFWHDEKRFKGSGSDSLVQAALLAAGGRRTGGHAKEDPSHGPLGWQRLGAWDVLWSPSSTALQVSFTMSAASLPWILKPLIGLLSDCVPLCGYRRKSYLVAAGLTGKGLQLVRQSEALAAVFRRQAQALEYCKERARKAAAVAAEGAKGGAGPTAGGRVGQRRPDPNEPRPFVVAQRYVPDPLLINGRKFGLRLWVVALGPDPLRAYLHRNGLVLFATEPYDHAEAGGGGAGSGMYGSMYGTGHVTNYAQNVDGEVWGLRQLREHLGAERYRLLYRRILASAALTLAAALPARLRGMTKRAMILAVRCTIDDPEETAAQQQLQRQAMEAQQEAAEGGAAVGAPQQDAAHAGGGGDGSGGFTAPVDAAAAAAAAFGSCFAGAAAGLGSGPAAAARAGVGQAPSPGVQGSGRAPTPAPAESHRHQVRRLPPTYHQQLQQQHQQWQQQQQQQQLPCADRGVDGSGAWGSMLTAQNSSGAAAGVGGATSMEGSEEDELQMLWDQHGLEGGGASAAGAATGPAAGEVAALGLGAAPDWGRRPEQCRALLPDSLLQQQWNQDAQQLQVLQHLPPPLTEDMTDAAASTDGAAAAAPRGPRPSTPVLLATSARLLQESQRLCAWPAEGTYPAAEAAQEHGSGGPRPRAGGRENHKREQMEQRDGAEGGQHAWAGPEPEHHPASGATAVSGGGAGVSAGSRASRRKSGGCYSHPQPYPRPHVRPAMGVAEVLGASAADDDGSGGGSAKRGRTALPEAALRLAARTPAEVAELVAGMGAGAAAGGGAAWPLPYTTPDAYRGLENGGAWVPAPLLLMRQPPPQQQPAPHSEAAALSAVLQRQAPASASAAAGGGGGGGSYTAGDVLRSLESLARSRAQSQAPPQAHFEQQQQQQQNRQQEEQQQLMLQQLRAAEGEAPAGPVGWDSPAAPRPALGAVRAGGLGGPWAVPPSYTGPQGESGFSLTSAAPTAVAHSWGQVLHHQQLQQQQAAYQQQQQQQTILQQQQQQQGSLPPSAFALSPGAELGGDTWRLLNRMLDGAGGDGGGEGGLGQGGDGGATGGSAPLGTAGSGDAACWASEAYPTAPQAPGHWAPPPTPQQQQQRQQQPLHVEQLQQQQQQLQAQQGLQGPQRAASLQGPWPPCGLTAQQAAGHAHSLGLGPGPAAGPLQLTGRASAPLPAGDGICAAPELGPQGPFSAASLRNDGGSWSALPSPPAPPQTGALAAAAPPEAWMAAPPAPTPFARDAVWGGQGGGPAGADVSYGSASPPYAQPYGPQYSMPYGWQGPPPPSCGPFGGGGGGVTTAPSAPAAATALASGAGAAAAVLPLPFLSAISSDLPPPPSGAGGTSALAAASLADLLDSWMAAAVAEPGGGGGAERPRGQQEVARVAVGGGGGGSEVWGGARVKSEAGGGGLAAGAVVWRDVAMDEGGAREGERGATAKAEAEAEEAEEEEAGELGLGPDAGMQELESMGGEAEEAWAAAAAAAASTVPEAAGEAGGPVGAPGAPWQALAGRAAAVAPSPTVGNGSAARPAVARTGSSPAAAAAVLAAGRDVWEESPFSYWQPGGGGPVAARPAPLQLPVLGSLSDLLMAEGEAEEAAAGAAAGARM